jgi:NADPH-dependent 2,4-dienoyl-CoA reductase/sulfur reductase-like enzyme/rhodanese-related sulfurtransferase
MKVIIIGAVAGGTSALAKIRRTDENAEIKVFTEEENVSYGVCGIPYTIGRSAAANELIPRDARWFKEHFNVDILTRHKVTAINRKEKTVTVKNLQDDSLFQEPYNKLIIATGAHPVRLGIEADSVFYVKTPDDADAINKFLTQHSCKTAEIVGSGFIGLEMAEALSRRGLTVTITEKAPSLMPALDKELSYYLQKALETAGITIQLNTGFKKPTADITIIAVGIRANAVLAAEAGIELGESGAIKTNAYMETSDKDIFAVGDCAESFSLITGHQLWRPLGSTANKTGRLAAINLTGRRQAFPGILGTAIVESMGVTAAMTGLREEEARSAGYDVITAHIVKAGRPSYYYEETHEMIIKVVADKKSERILGAQIVGHEGVDKRIDVLATAISFKAKASDLINLDLAYAPPFATVRDPIIYVGMILDGAINNNRELAYDSDLCTDGVVVIDAREPLLYNTSHIKGAVNIPLAELRSKIDTLSKQASYIVYCNKGVTANAAQNILLNNGFKAKNLDGGFIHHAMTSKHKI